MREEYFNNHCQKWAIKITEDNFEMLKKWRGHLESKHGFLIYPARNKTIYNTEWSQNNCYENFLITTQDFIDHVLNKELIGYVFKEECKKYLKASVAINKGSYPDYFKGEAPYLPLSAKNVIQRLKDAQVLDEWFDPVFGKEIELPLFYGHTGTYIQDENIVRYPNAELDLYVPTVRNLINLSPEISNRFIEEITIFPNMRISLTILRDIVKYVDWYDYIRG